MKSYIVATCVDYSYELREPKIFSSLYVLRKDNTKKRGSEHAGIPSECKNQFHFPNPGLAPGSTAEGI